MSIPLRRVVLVDDHDLFRAGVRSQLGKTVEVVGEAGTVADAVPLIKELDPDVVLLDVHLPDGGGQAVIVQVAPERPGVRFLALSVSDAAEDVIGVIRAGARGYITKQEATRNILQAIRRVLGGDIYLNERSATKIITRLTAKPGPGGGTPADSLADRELQVFELTGRGCSTRQIAEQLGIDVKTVETYRSRIKEKLRLRDSSELLQLAIRWNHTR